MIPEAGGDVTRLLSTTRPATGSKKKKIDADMRIVLGYLNQSELITNLNIGNIM